MTECTLTRYCGASPNSSQIATASSRSSSAVVGVACRSPHRQQQSTSSVFYSQQSNKSTPPSLSARRCGPGHLINTNICATTNQADVPGDRTRRQVRSVLLPWVSTNQQSKVWSVVTQSQCARYPCLVAGTVHRGNIWHHKLRVYMQCRDTRTDLLSA